MSWMLSCIGCGSKKLAEKEEAKVLDFQHFSLTTVPPYVFECERVLEELYLDCNQIAELPKELFLCNELQILSLSDNDLHNIPPAISSLTNLTSLDLSKNGISDIPDSIKGCKRLHCVNASTNPLCRLPEGFTQLVALRELSLSDTFLEYLPANFGRLTGLEVLELRENQLNTLPRSMTRLSALKRLDLGQNEFTELPEVVGHLTNLTDLWIDNNRVKRIPSEIGKLQHLSFVDATKNRLNEIDPQIGNCKRLSDLYLTRNELEELPDTLCHCTKLSTLHADDNHLEQLPDNIGYLDRLVELKASQNELSSLPPSVGLLRSLQFLHVDDNLLTSLPSELGSCASLIVVTAAHNHVREMPAEMGSLPRLRVLNLCGNLIQDLPVSFSKLQLTALWLSENQAKPSVPLQCTNDSSGQKVLTCFMLPQSLTQSSPTPDRVDDDRPLTEAEIEARRARSMIHFASDGDQKPPGRLTRVPTPYPKELRALAKHTKNILALKKEREKEKEAIAATKEKQQVMKDAEQISPSKENSSALITLKTSSSAVKVAATVASESAIKSSSPQTEETVPGKLVTSALPETKNKVSVSEDASQLCQNGTSLKTSTSSPDSPQVTNELPSVSSLKERETDASRTVNKPTNYFEVKDQDKPRETPTSVTEHSVVTVASIKPPPPPSSPASASYEAFSSHGYPLDGRKESLHFGDTPSSLRPASIAVTDFTSNPVSHRGTYPMRPGSLALEGVMSPWQKQRPGSLAAPINTVGIPMSSQTKRAVSQNALHGMQSSQKNFPYFGETSKTFHSATHVTEEEELSPQTQNETFKEHVIIKHSNGGPLSARLPNERPSQLALDSSFDKTVGVKELNEKNHSQSSQEKRERNGSSDNTGLVSIINQVTEEALNEDRNVPQKAFAASTDGEEGKPTSRIPTFSPKHPHPSSPVPSLGEHNHSQMSPSEGQTYARSFSPSGIGGLSRIPHMSSTPKVAQITPPKLISPEGSGVSKVPAMSPPSFSKIQPPSFPSVLSPISKVGSNKAKAKSHIPTLASPLTKTEFDSEAKPEREEQLSTRIPQRDNLSNKEVSPLKGSSRIPTFSPPSCQTETKNLSENEPATSPTIVRSPSQTDRESFIPIKRTYSNPQRTDPIVSPVEKPINQTGIPILSPHETSSEKSSRIPTFSNSSLRGKKSLVSTPSQKELKYQVGRKYSDTSP